jgi:serine/threonine protein phosphatase PrpC
MDRSDPFVARRLDRGQDKLWTIVSRICGELGVSRALGDPDYKGIDRMNQSTNDWAWPLDRPLDQKRFLHDLVLGIPELTRIDIGHEHSVLLRNLSLTTTTTTTTTVATNKEEVTTNDSTLVPFLIVACDGLWEVMSSSEAMEIVIDYMRQNHYGTLNSIQKDSLYSNSNSLSSSSSLSMDKHNHHHDEDIPTEHIPTGAARRLVEMALKLGTSDNVTVMIIMLPPKNNLIPADSSSP